MNAVPSRMLRVFPISIYFTCSLPRIKFNMGAALQPNNDLLVGSSLGLIERRVSTWQTETHPHDRSEAHTH